ncbi:MAG: hypothetical protein M0026_02150 [Nocardiopsaceae bacterium]|nr:hypothetical protein [Nocardiopsaceae bacterium]
MPLEEGDPRQLGAYRLSERISAGAEGVVYLAHGADGRPVSIAMLSAGAAADPAARDRFAAAVAKGAGVTDAPAVLAANTTNPAASWVAVAHAEGEAGAEAFLAPVAVGAAERSAGTPAYAPHWAGRPAPMAARWSWSGGGRGSGAAVAAPGSSRPVIVALLVLLLLFAALLVLLYLWLSSLAPQAGQPVISPEPSPSQTQQTPSPSAPSPAPSDGPSGESSPTPEPSPSGSPTTDVPTVEVEETDQPGVPVDPGDQA